ncbi:MAG: hypothetical protein V1891_03210 [bacterium]
MCRKLLYAGIICLAVFCVFPYNMGFADEKLNAREFREEWTLERYAKYFYNRYSSHFDKRGFFYMAPDYGVNYWKYPVTAREYLSLAMYYKYRALDGDPKAMEILEDAIYNARREISSRPKNTQSFEDAETFFLMARIIEQIPGIFKNSKLENLNSEDVKFKKNLTDSSAQMIVSQDKLLEWIASYAEYGIKAPDTENRAIISAAHWQYIIDYLGAKEYINSVDRKRYSKMLKDKIDFAIKTNIKNYWYIEGRFDDFTPHYHAVSAYMLMVYSKLTGDDKYFYIAKKMYKNLKMSSFDNGMVEAQLGHRPRGLGAQFYLMAGLLGKSVGDSDYTTYLFYGFGDRFFSDPNYPNRLEYHSTVEGEEPYFHDDYSFADKAEFALAIPSLAGFSTATIEAAGIFLSQAEDGDKTYDDNFKIGVFDKNLTSSIHQDDMFKFTYKLFIPKVISQKKFIQKNTGREIIFGEKKIILGSFGNYSRIAK